MFDTTSFRSKVASRLSAPLPSKHLGCQRRGQIVIVHIVGINGGNVAGQNLQWIFLQDALDLPLHALGPGEQVSLEALSRLHQLLLLGAEA
ncbi:hypothetical protein INR49_027750 [Caranx melampygus]|nr:hypothetical protein INR49_027750 [Caranx melampygus]